MTQAFDERESKVNEWNQGIHIHSFGWTFISHSFHSHSHTHTHTHSQGYTRTTTTILTLLSLRQDKAIKV